VLDGPQAEMLRDLVAAEGTAAAGRAPTRGLAKLLRRNPTEAERLLWQALVSDRRFAGLGFKRQVPVGPHITDFVSFPLKCVIDLVPPAENDGPSGARAEKRKWFGAHDYWIISIETREIEANVARSLDIIEAQLRSSGRG
jgi:tRNA/rRNA methyltransferase